MKNAVFVAPQFDKAYVVFTDNTSLWWLRLLKPGFRHCYLLLSCRGGRCWLELNPYSDQIEVSFCEFAASQSETSLLRTYENCLVCPVKIKKDCFNHLCTPSSSHMQKQMMLQHQENLCHSLSANICHQLP